jgi:hypothetical protein
MVTPRPAATVILGAPQIGRSLNVDARQVAEVPDNDLAAILPTLHGTITTADLFRPRLARHEARQDEVITVNHLTDPRSSAPRLAYERGCNGALRLLQQPVLLIN